MTPLVASADAASLVVSLNAKLDAVAVSDGGVAVSEGGIRTFTIALTSAPASGEVVEVSYTLGGSATSGADANSGDYVASVGGSGNSVPSGSSAGVVVLSSGATSVDVTISVNEDALSEVAEGVSLQISEVRVGADAAAAMGGSAAVAAGDVDVGSVTPLVASADAASFMIARTRS